MYPLSRSIATSVATALLLVLESASSASAQPAETAPSAPPPGDAPATEDGVARSRKLFFEAVAAEDARQYARAIELYEEVRKNVASPQVLFNLANCHEKLDRLLAARELFDAAIVEAEKRNAPDVATEARVRRDRVVTRIPRIVLRPQTSAASAEIRVDDAVVDPQAGPVLVDPGPHHVVARAPDNPRVYEISFPLEAGTSRTLVVDLDAPPLAPTPPPAGDAPPPSPPPRRNFTWPIAFGGVALAAGASAIVTGVAGYSDRDRYLELNAAPTSENREERESLRSSGNTLYAVSGVLTAAFVVSAGVAIYLALRSPGAPRPTRAAVPLHFSRRVSQTCR